MFRDVHKLWHGPSRVHRVSNTCVLYGTVHLCVESGDVRAACANRQDVETPTYLPVFGLQHDERPPRSPPSSPWLRGVIDVCHLAATMRVPVSYKPV